MIISIHAPTRGATPKKAMSHKTYIISIHAPTRGATRCLDAMLEDCKNFNPRSHERSDKTAVQHRRQQIYFNPRSHERSDEFYAERIDKANISIHAPTRGATRIAFDVEDFEEDFNPRSHERSDSNIAQKICLFLYNTDNKYIIR